MQDYGSGKLVFSATDLAVASECQWAQVRRIDKVLGHKITVPKDDDAMLVRAGELGDVHELKQLEAFRAQFPGGVVEIERPDRSKSETLEAQMLELSQKTLEALKSKAPVVFQATFFDGEFQGFADFLILNADGKYAVYDTKLARKAKITALIQLAAYAHQLDLNSIPVSDQVHLILGDQSISTFNLEDILPTYLLRRKKMQDLIQARRASKEAGNDAVAWNDPSFDACGRCAVCEPHVKENDDLLLIAGMRSDQRMKLMAVGINTATDLAVSAPEKVEGFNQRSYAKITGQARLQYKTKKSATPKIPEHELINASGLEALPLPNPGDIFFDFEGDPLYQEGRIWNLDYLFGYVDEKSNFEPIWAHSIAEEKLALVKFVDELKKRLAAFPGMHVYHYASYEKTHLLSLAARHGYAEDFVDDLLRNNTLVDLYPIVRRALVIGAEGYSLKKLEPIFMSEKERAGVSNAKDSVVEYANYCELVANGELAAASVKLADIEQYNAYDCRATLGLRNWLVELAKENGVELKGSGSLELPAEDDEPQDPLFENLMALIADTPVSERTPDQTAIALAAAAIDFHRREKKSFWWAHYDRLVSPVEDWQDTRDVYVVNDSVVERDWHKEGGQRKARRHLKIHASPAPGSSLKEGSQIFLVYPDSSGDLVEAAQPGYRIPVSCHVIDVIDDSTFIIEELVGKSALQHNYTPEAVTPGTPPRTKNIELAIRAWGEELLDSYPNLQRDPALDVLRRQSPFIAPLAAVEPATAIKKITDTLLDMEVGTLAVQGPPGSGKSYSGGHVIAELVRDHGWKVGVVAQSHATVLNLLASVHKAGLPKNLIGKGVDKTELPELQENSPAFWTPYLKGTDSTFTSSRDGFVVGGTVYDFAKTEAFPPDSLDLLVIDEAGQFSLANTIAASIVAKRMLLLGDPQQLPQVTQGTHPEPVDGSALGWLIGDQAVMPPEFGFFLPTSWRMNKDLCEVVSKNFYNSQLDSSAKSRSLEGVDQGLHSISMRHSTNSTESIEEADKIVELIQALLNKNWQDGSYDGPLDTAEENIIVVAPYNAQVLLIRARLASAGLRKIPVGTVDKFQGKEAAVAIVSMTASSAQDVPRGIEFLFMPNRLNVAISRAKWAAYLIYSPGLLDYKPTNVDNLRLLSKFVNLVGDSSI
jgi:predicted RecB family nuclease